MTDDVRDIPPALSETEWADALAALDDRSSDILLRSIGKSAHDVALLAKTIALANAAMHDEDPRKFTWETVDNLRDQATLLLRRVVAVESEEGRDAERLHDLADVIESYLPPRA